ncbi:hypothetical protein [Halomonas sp. RA08-2]|uniref:hypothetical protein n=1 Tax=Halomonas sp. RA08-2 TaxID=3440842 RepID=UPI003EE8CB28
MIHTNRIDALAELLHHRLVRAERPLEMAAMIRFAKGNGCTAADARLAVHRLVQKQKAAFTTDPLTVSVKAVGVRV